MPRRGGKRVKKRTHVRSVDPKQNNGGKAAIKALTAPVKSTAAKKKKEVEATTNNVKEVPRSIVVSHGKSSAVLKELVHDLRNVMSPNTAMKLRTKQKASMKEYVNAATALKVSHIMVVSQASKAPTLKITRLPQGPTVTFRVQQYALSQQIRSSQKKLVDYVTALKFSPLVVLNNFESKNLENRRHMKIASVTFQAMFPSINVRTVKLQDCQRVLLVHLEDDADVIEIRHYLIHTNISGVSRQVKKLVKAQVPDLGHLQDISDVILGDAMPGGYATSESEFEDEEAMVDVNLKMQKQNKSRRADTAASQQSMVKLVEIGPRLSLSVYKIEDGMFSGEVQYHAHETRDESEIVKQRQEHEEKMRTKQARKIEQEENVKRKLDELEEKRERKRAKKERRLLRAQERLENGKEDDIESAEESDDEEDEEEDTDNSQGESSESMDGSSSNESNEEESEEEE